MRPIAVLAALAAAYAGCGVEQFRERAPAQDLELRFVADEGQRAEPLPRLGSSAETALPVETAVVVDARHIRRVRLLDGADGRRVLVLDLDDVGRARLEEASRERAGARLAVVAGGRVIAAPTIRGPLTEGEAYISVPEASLEEAFGAMTRP